MLHGPEPVGGREQAGVLLAVGQSHADGLGAQGVYGAFVKQALPHVGLVVVGIEVDHVAAAEVLLSARLCGQGQRHGVVAAVGSRAAQLLDGEVVEDVARLVLLAERHEPQVAGCSAAVVQPGLAAAQLVAQLLAVDEGHHALVVGPFQWTEGRNLGGDGRELGLHILVVDAVLRHIFIYTRGREQGHNAAKALAGHQQLGAHDLVAQADGLAQQLLVVVHGHQALGGRIARVEQAYVH